MFLELFGFICLMYILMGVVSVARRIEEIKAEADSNIKPRWVVFMRSVLMWLPNRFLD